jgi:hypothetical protein
MTIERHLQAVRPAAHRSNICSNGGPCPSIMPAAADVERVCQVYGHVGQTTLAKIFLGGIPSYPNISIVLHYSSMLVFGVVFFLGFVTRAIPPLSMFTETPPISLVLRRSVHR